jgi:hypothetical protein
LAVVDENIDVRSLDALISFLLVKKSKAASGSTPTSVAVNHNGINHIEHLWHGRPAIR